MEDQFSSRCGRIGLYYRLHVFKRPLLDPPRWATELPTKTTFLEVFASPLPATNSTTQRLDVFPTTPRRVPTIHSHAF